MPDVLPLWVYKTKMFIVNMYILCLHESVHMKNIKYLSAFHREKESFPQLVGSRFQKRYKLEEDQITSFPRLYKL